jgi:hypothetical protein
MSPHNCIGVRYPKQLGFVQKVQMAGCIVMSIVEIIRAQAPFLKERAEEYGYTEQWPDVVGRYRQIFTGLPPISRVYTYVHVAHSPCITTTKQASW